MDNETNMDFIDKLLSKLDEADKKIVVDTLLVGVVAFCGAVIANLSNLMPSSFEHQMAVTIAIMVLNFVKEKANKKLNYQEKIVGALKMAFAPKEIK